MPTPSHRSHPAWQKAMQLAEQLYRLADLLDQGKGRRIADQLCNAAAALPGRMVRVDDARRAEDRLLEIESLLLLAVRLGHLGERNIDGPLTFVTDLRELVSAARPQRAEAPAPRPQPPALRQADAAPPTPVAQPPSPAPATGVERLLVDGCNFLGRAPGFSLGDDSSRERLVLRLQDYAHRHPAHRVVVFFDGQRAATRVVAGVEERVTSGRRPADDLLLDYLLELAEPDRTRCTMVTDDRDLAQKAGQLGAHVQTVAWLTTQFAPKRPSGSDAAARGKVGRDAVSEWEEFFNQPPQRPGKK